MGGRRIGRPAPAAARRVPGRPRSSAADAAILRAGLELFVEHGIGGASIQQIARRAGVSRATIYRRWPGREELLAQAIEAWRNASGLTAEVVDRTPPAAFPRLLLDACKMLARPEIRNVMARLLGSLPDYPQLMAVYRESYFLPRRQAFLQALERARTAGVLAPGADVQTLAEMIAGALMHRLLFAPPAENAARELRAFLTKLLRQAGFRLPRSPRKARRKS